MYLLCVFILLCFTQVYQFLISVDTRYDMNITKVIVCVREFLGRHGWGRRDRVAVVLRTGCGGGNNGHIQVCTCECGNINTSLMVFTACRLRSGMYYERRLHYRRPNKVIAPSQSTGCATVGLWEPFTDNRDQDTKKTNNKYLSHRR